ncbi:HET-domain-containing protein [Pleurostoma richardsiae]|uniref:HET-domain-containing protein n=1 Tax=Pleurostoma richardsiae TaxID=41990 RepID=A0AA38RSR8_9PEZI|nr:HET-domain-containing protein [Pleurostoma richardsiae]
MADDDDSARRSPGATFDLHDYSTQVPKPPPLYPSYQGDYPNYPYPPNPYSASPWAWHSSTPSYQSGSITPPTLSSWPSLSGISSFYEAGGFSGSKTPPLDNFDASSNNATGYWGSALPTESSRLPFSYSNHVGDAAAARPQMYPSAWGPVAAQVTNGRPVEPVRYSHTRLEPDKIRLLKLHPALAFSEPIHAQLIPVPIQETVTVEYEALSYAWGTSLDKHTIFLSDGRFPLTDTSQTDTEDPPPLRSDYQPFEIRSSLYGALKRLRSATRDILLWVDALCIDQKHDGEKASQLPKMPQIYSNAWSVVIWLGEEPQNSETERLAMDFIPRMLNLTLLDALLENEGEDGQILRSWIAFADLLKRPWFRRRWVIQEIAYAKRVAIRCGEKVLSWLDFADAIEILMRRLDKVAGLYNRSTLYAHDADALDHVYSGRALALVNAINTVFRKTRTGEVLDRLWSLEFLVTEYTSFEATNPRDIIYAFLSLANDGPLASETIPGAEKGPGTTLLPQYERDPIDVYIDFVKYCVETSKSLDIICRYWVSYSDHRKSLPSWVGMVRNSAFGSPSHSNGRINGDSLVGKSKQRIYNASRGLLAEAHFEKPADLRARTAAYNQLSSALGATSGSSSVPLNPSQNMSITSILSPISGENRLDGRNGGEIDTTEYPKTQIRAAALPGPSRPNWHEERASLKRRSMEIEEQVPLDDPTAERRKRNRLAREKYMKRREQRLRNFECCLFAKGIVLGRISKVSPRVIDGIIPGDCLSILGWEKEMDFNSFPDQLWRTLVADRDADGRNAPMWYKRACAYAMLRASPEGDLNTAKIVASKSQPESIVEYCKRVQSIVWNRTIFSCGDAEDDESVDIRSSPGTERLVGLGSRYVSVGDIVCILFGCSVPVILKERDGKFKLMGEAYVYGKMDGEAFAGMDLSVIQSQATEFEIR